MFLYLFLLLLIPSVSLSQPPNQMLPPHLMEGVETGFLKGTLLKLDQNGNKKILTGQPVVLAVFFQGQRVLMLNKTTDDQGRFQFKNIIKDPNYTFAVGSMLGNKLYVKGDLSLAKDKEVIRVEFPIGEGSPYEVFEEKNTAAREAPPPAGKTEFTVKSAFAYPYQKIALALCGLSFLLGLSYLVKRT